MLRRICTFAHKPLVGYFLILSILHLSLISCEKNLIEKNIKEENHQSQDYSSIKQSINNYTAEEIFEAIMFCHGPVVEKIPLLEEIGLENLNNNDSLSSSIVEFNKEIIKLIKESNPQFFSKFRAKIQSGNHLVIKDILIESKEIVMNLINILDDVKIEETEINAAKNTLVNILENNNVNLSDIGNLKQTIKDNVPPDWITSKPYNHNYKWTYAWAYAYAYFFLVLFLFDALPLVANPNAQPINNLNNVMGERLIDEIAVNLKR